MSQFLRNQLVNVTRRTRRFVIPESLTASDSLRLDQVIPQVAGISRRQARKLISENKISVNGRKTRKLSKEIQDYDVVEIPLDFLSTHELQKSQETFDFDVFKLNKWFLVLNKPAGKLFQLKEDSNDEPRSEQATLEKEAKTLLALHYNKRPPFVHVMHRLDRVTSGCSLFVLKRSMLPLLQEAWANGTVERRYRAVVEGNPSWNMKTVRAPIGRDKRQHWKFKATPSGKPARTVVSVVAHGDGYSIVDCLVSTGRTHQIRVHLSHLGHPVLGDYLYGAQVQQEEKANRRVMLHAHSIRFRQLVRNIRLNVTSPLPSEFIQYQKHTTPVEVYKENEESDYDEHSEDDEHFASDMISTGDTTALARIEAMRDLADETFNSSSGLMPETMDNNGQTGTEKEDPTVSSKNNVEFQFELEDR